MVLLAGADATAAVGAAVFTWLQDAIARNTDYWRHCGPAILAIVLAFRKASWRLRARFGAKEEAAWRRLDVAVIAKSSAACRGARRRLRRSGGELVHDRAQWRGEDHLP